MGLTEFRWKGWQTRYYVLTPGSCLSYYDSPNGSKLGEIPLQGAAIGRQSSSRAAADGTIGEDAYLHAFLIRTQNEKEKEEDHILCAENDDMRDRWVQALTTVQGRGGGSVSHVQVPVPGGVKSVNERERTMSNSPTNPLPPPTVIATSDSDPSSLSNRDSRRSGSGPVGSTVLPEQDPRGLSARLNSDFPPSVSLPANLDAVARNGGSLDSKKGTSSSETGHSQASYASTPTSNKLQPPPSRRSNVSAPDRPLSPDGRRNEAVVQPGSTSKYSASDVSGPMNAVPLPSGYEFKKAERQKKTKSSFWNFAARGTVSFPNLLIVFVVLTCSSFGCRLERQELSSSTSSSFSTRLWSTSQRSCRNLSYSTRTRTSSCRVSLRRVSRSEGTSYFLSLWLQNVVTHRFFLCARTLNTKKGSSDYPVRRT